MNRTLTLPGDLYSRLQLTARRHGLPSVEQLLEEWQTNEDELQRRTETVRQADALRERLLAAYGEMPDSVDLIREDRDRR